MMNPDLGDTPKSPLLLVVLTGLVWSVAGVHAQPGIVYPPSPKRPVYDTLHGVVITDDYRWLESDTAAEVKAWTKAQNKLTRSFLDTLPQRPYLVRRFNELWRYDDQGIPIKVIRGERIFYYVKKKDAEKIAWYTKEDESAPLQVLIDPNQWSVTEELYGFTPSFDGRYVAFGKTKAGNEDPVVRVMEVATQEILPDTLRGRRQIASSWLPDNSGFYYSASPSKGTVPAGEEEYWYAAYFHRLGTAADQDQKVFWHDSVKEYGHGVSVTEDGQYLLFYRGLGARNELYFKRLGADGPPTPIATGLDGSYEADIVEGRIIITTDSAAPMQKVYWTTVDKPDKRDWRTLIPENKLDKLQSLSAIDHHLYATYLHNAYTLVRIYDLDGSYIRELPFPTLGSAYVGGYWSKPDVWVHFTSFVWPPTLYKYDFASNHLNLFHKFPLDINVSDFAAEQVWFKSRDGTPVSMFLVHRKDVELNGSNPVLLSGYGGFDIPVRPRFSTLHVLALELGAVVAIPNLRGGGEYGKAWHEAGMLGKKQNVFDDFIAAAEWLIANHYTSPQHIAISGGSNGGLLVGAATVQRPDLFRVVHCSVPLLDMLRYHKFGFANRWATEYGTSDDSAQFRYLYQYSPYHNVRDGTKYPAMLIEASESDARVGTMHARKMAARVQAADAGPGPVLLEVHEASGHGGGTTLSADIEQAADRYAFLLAELGVKVPREPPQNGPGR